MHGDELPWRDLRDGMLDRGWLDLTNATGELTVGGRRIVFAGVDDSHLKRDRYDQVAGPADPAADVRIGLAHSPEPRVLDRFAADGYDLLLCGHTHGGQLRVPVLRGAGHQLRHRPRRACGGCTAGPSRTRTADRHLAARLGGPGHEPVRAGPLRLPAGGHAAHPDRPRAPEPAAGPRGTRALDSCRHLGVWRSLVARVVRDDEAAGSNPVTPTHRSGAATGGP